MNLSTEKLITTALIGCNKICLAQTPINYKHRKHTSIHQRYLPIEANQK